MKRFFALLGLVAVAVAAALTSGRMAKADSCTDTGFTYKGVSMTARYVNPATLPGTVDASGCNIGVYYGPGHTGTVDATVENANYFGVVANGTAVNVTDSTISNIGESPLNGSQHGVGVYYTGGATGSVDGNTISAFQKNGVAVTDGANVSVTNNTVTGESQITYIAQNGIEFYQATGVATGNTISGIYYTGCSSKDAAQTGCTAWVATGLLLYDVDANAVKTSNNMYRNDQRNHLLLTSSSLG